MTSNYISVFRLQNQDESHHFIWAPSANNIVAEQEWHATVEKTYSLCHFESIEKVIRIPSAWGFYR